MPQRRLLRRCKPFGTGVVHRASQSGRGGRSRTWIFNRAM
jgi:hypothetical protein